VVTQTRRHSYIASLLGIKHIVVAVNKMDLLDFSESVFEKIKADYLAFAKKLGMENVFFVPMSALNGDNVVNRSVSSPWYKGQTLMEILENVPIAGDKNFSDFRLPVQYVNRPNLNFRGFCGNIASGVVKVGDAIKALPSGKTSTVKSIVTYDGDLPEAFAGQAVTLTLDTEIDISRGDMIALASEDVPLTNHLQAHVVWMTEKAVQPNSDFLFKFASKTVSGQLEAIHYRIDVNTQEEIKVEQLQLNDIAVVDVLLTQSVVLDSYKNNRATGAFIVIDRLTNITVGAGMVVKRLDDKTVAAQTNFSEFELELNALVRKHFPHWGAADLTQLLKK
jgi:sulfate adenylyltransferase subunit 1